MEPQFTEREATMLTQVHHAIFGNGQPENSLLTRVYNMEKLMRAIMWLGATATGALVVIAVNQVFG